MFNGYVGVSPQNKSRRVFPNQLTKLYAKGWTRFIKE
tara:strand:- start:10 stop:120 length:111 start_codon:yes stop_codon:yes gene_type:complete